jgi:hypothetical protein
MELIIPGINKVLFLFLIMVFFAARPFMASTLLMPRWAFIALAIRMGIYSARAAVMIAVASLVVAIALGLPS